MADENSAELARLRDENSRRRAKLAAANAELAKLRTELTQLTSERDELRAAKPGDDEVSSARGELADLRGQLRLYKHQAGLKELVYSEEIGANPQIPLEKLIALSGYKADSDDFDPAAAKKLFVQLHKTDPYLFAQGEEAPEPAPGRQTNPDQSHLWRAVKDRGQTNGVGGPNSGEITREQARDAVFVMERAAQLRRDNANR